MKPGFGTADYALYLDRKAIGAIEAKAGGTLTGVEAQTAKYAVGLPDDLPAHHPPPPFLFESNGSVTYFTNGLDPAPRSRQVFNFPRPETLANRIAQPMQLRTRLKEPPPLDEARLWTVQARAIRNLEESFAEAHPRALIQMATGSGKTFTAVNVIYRLLRFNEAKRILFLVDRSGCGSIFAKLPVFTAGLSPSSGVRHLIFVRGPSRHACSKRSDRINDGEDILTSFNAPARPFHALVDQDLVGGRRRSAQPLALRLA